MYDRHKPSKHMVCQTQKRQLPKRVQEIAWKAQERLHHRYMRLLMNGKAKNKVTLQLRAYFKASNELTGGHGDMSTMVFKQA